MSVIHHNGKADRCQFVDCRILGHQDTIFAEEECSRHYLLRCFIDGIVDLIFGSATALFEYCTINSKSNSYVTAVRTTQSKDFGNVFVNCKFTADNGIDRVYRGRPWRIYA